MNYVNLTIEQFNNLFFKGVNGKDCFVKDNCELWNVQGLKSCPFCGGIARRINSSGPIKEIRCFSCGSSCHSIYGDLDVEIRWNTRVN